jgi:hypothetical protein
MANAVYNFSLIVLILGIVLVVFSAGALVWSGTIKEREASQKLANDEIAIAQSKAALELAKADLAETNKRLAESEKEGSEAKFEETKLKSAASWREITPEQRDLFAAFVKDFPKGKVLIDTVVANPEAANYARQMSDMLKGVGYTVVEKYSTADAAGPPPVGIQMKIKSMDEQPVYAGSLQKALEYIDIDTAGSLDDRAENAVLIFVGVIP